MRFNSVLVMVVLLVLTVSSAGSVQAQSTIDDRAALSGVQSGRALFDINVTTADKLELYLMVIMKTHEDLLRQGLKPEFVIAFRGAAVRLISSELWSLSEEDRERLTRAHASVAKLSELGVKMEACSIATELFRVENSTILPQIEVVGNTFVSLIGYQAKGYGLIPIQ